MPPTRPSGCPLDQLLGNEWPICVPSHCPSADSDNPAGAARRAAMLSSFTRRSSPLSRRYDISGREIYAILLHYSRYSASGLAAVSANALVTELHRCLLARGREIKCPCDARYCRDNSVPLFVCDTEAVRAEIRFLCGRRKASSGPVPTKQRTSHSDNNVQSQTLEADERHIARRLRTKRWRARGRLIQSSGRRAPRIRND